LSSAERVRDRISSYTRDLTVRVGNDIPVLDVETRNLGDGRADELSDHGNLLAGVDSKARPIERRVTHAVRVEVAAGLVTSALSGVWRRTGGSSASTLSKDGARVRGVRRGDLVSFPHIHFGAARSHRSTASVCVIWTRGPSCRVCDSIDELHVCGALRVAITCSIVGSGLVGSIGFSDTAVSVHLGEVESAVETARELGHINVECEFLVFIVESLILRCTARSHQIDTATDVGLLAIGDEFQRERISTCADPVCPRVISAIESAVSRTSFSIRASGGVPSVSCVAVRESTGAFVEPAPIGVEHNGGVLSGAGGPASSCAFLPGQSRVYLRCVGPSQLTESGREKSGEEEKTGSRHD